MSTFPFAGFLDSLPDVCDVLRPYQRQGLAEISQAVHAGDRRILRQLSTGAGKTHEIAAVTLAASQAGLRVLILATRTRLVRQIHERLEAFGVDHGVLAAELPVLRNLLLPVQVASADTLYRRCLGDGRTPLPTAEIVIFDEAHLAAADSRMAILARYPEALHLGFTATPARKSGRSLSAAFERLILGPSILELIQTGNLVKPRIFNVPVISREELKALPKENTGDFAVGQLSGLMSKAKLVGDVTENWLKIASGKRSIVFAVNKAHGAFLTEDFSRRGIAAELLTDEDDEPTREAVIGRLEAGQTNVIVNCFLMSYGADIPSVECIVLARPTRSLTMYLQMVGRGMRPAPGKSDFLLIDHGRVVENLGLPTMDFGWSLDDTRNVSREAEARTRLATVEQPRTCPECAHMWLVSEGGNACSECGWVPTPRAKPITVQAANLGELDTEGKAAVRPNSPEVATFYRMACGWDMRRSGNLWQGADPATGKSRANKRRWVAWMRTRERFELAGDMRMPSAFWNLAPMEPSTEAAGWLKYSLIRWQRGKGRAA